MSVPSIQIGLSVNTVDYGNPSYSSVLALRVYCEFYIMVYPADVYQDHHYVACDVYDTECIINVTVLYKEVFYCFV